MVWVYDRTQSLFLAMLLHVSLTTSTLALTPLTTGVLLLTYNLAFAAAVWVIVAAVGVGNRSPLSDDALRRRVA